MFQKSLKISINANQTNVKVTLTVEGRSPVRKMISFGFCPNEGGGGPCPNFLAHIQEVHFWPIKESIK